MNEFGKSNSLHHNQTFESGFIAFAIGISLYFCVPPFLSVWAVSVLFLLCLVVWGAGLVLGAKIARPSFSFVLGMMALFCFGYWWTQIHTKMAQRPILPDYERTYTVKGWVEKVNKSGRLHHVYIRVSSLSSGYRGGPANLRHFDPNKAGMPERVRVRMKLGPVQAADYISVTAVLSAPKPPVLAGGYDPARAAYYKKIGGYGFAISKVKVLDPKDIARTTLTQPPTFRTKITQWTIRQRYGISRRIMARAPPHTAALQTALLTGDRSHLPDQQTDDMRAAGLAHILAISGLHMGMLAGGAYGIASFLLACIGPLARRYDMRKVAAIIGIVVARIYLVLSGASVSTGRAYIMAVVMFSALIMGRRAISVRSVAVAGSITLMSHPESLMNAGFQMSYAASLSLVVVYHCWRRYKALTGYKRPNMAAKSHVSQNLATQLFWRGGHKATQVTSRAGRGIIGLSATSLIAGVATAGFAALHFNRISKYGFWANLAAMPVFTFIVMPLGFFSILVMPLGLDVYTLKGMGLGLEWVLKVANKIAIQPTSLIYVKSPPSYVLGLFGLGFVFLCLALYQLKIRQIVYGGLIIAMSVFLWSANPRADMRISQSARIAYWDQDQINVLRVDKKRGDGFGRSQFVRASGIGAAQIDVYDTDAAFCDDMACRMTIKNYRVTIAKEPEMVGQACLESDLIILRNRQAGAKTRAMCRAVLIDEQDLRLKGAHNVRFGVDGISMAVSNPNQRRKWPWG